MHISRVLLKNFRCFNHLELCFDNAPIILLQGVNGSGKTSILEALHYMCYLRSFRTYCPQELINFGNDLFFIHIVLEKEQLHHEVCVGFTQKKRSVKIDQRSISSYKELLDHFKIISIGEDDLALIKGTPEERRTFVDQALLLLDPSYAQTLRLYRQKLHHKNALLHKRNITPELYAVWTDQVLAQASIIRHKRIEYIAQLQAIVNDLIEKHFGKDLFLALTYQTKQSLDLENTQDVYQQAPLLYQQECIMGRSLYGAHLDDITCYFSSKSARSFASRGQQKLSVLLLKIAQLIHLNQVQGPAIMLLDDFMTDFDIVHAKKLLAILKSLSVQLIFTSPLSQGPIEHLLANSGAQVINITK